MKKIILYSIVISSLLILVSCGGSGGGTDTTSSSPTATLAATDTQGEETEVEETEEDTFSAMDTSQPLTKQLQTIFSNLEPNSSFYGVKIKEVSQPSKFVGTWTMWDKFRGDTSTFNADGTCSDEFFYYKTGERKKTDCLEWYHVTLEKDNSSFLFFLYKDYFFLASYEWNDENNLYLYYYNGDGHLATRVGSNPLADKIEERFLLGTWVEENHSYSDYNRFWTFDSNHNFYVETYTTPDNELHIDDKGTWSLDKTKLKFFMEERAEEEDRYYDFTLPPKAEVSLSFFNGVERLGIDAFERYSEPLLFSGDPYVGRFQGHATYNSQNVMSLTVTKTDTESYSVDIFWNNQSLLQNSAKKVNGYLYVETEVGTVIFQAVINGMKKVNYLEENLFDFPERLLRISQEPSSKSSSIIGKWVQSDHYSIPEKYRYLTFLENGQFFHENGNYKSKIGRQGSYRKEGDKLYLKPQCGKEEVVENIVTLNKAHLTPASYEGTSFVKVTNSESLSSIFNALLNYLVDYKKELIKLTPHPRYKGKFLFAEEISYSSVGFISIHFKVDGKSFVNFQGQVPVGYEDYYIEAKNQKVESIVLSPKNNPQSLKFYDARQTICYDDKWELGISSEVNDAATSAEWDAAMVEYIQSQHISWIMNNVDLGLVKQSH